MADPHRPGARDRLLEAAAGLIAAAPGRDVSLRSICDEAGVKLPTLYHHFGSKEGLLDAVVEHGFDLYLNVKEGNGDGTDPIGALRAGWDAHVDFAVANPGFYALMYGQVAPGSRPAGQDRPGQILLALTRSAADQGLLVVDAEQAAAHVLAANVGVALRQITLAHVDPELSAAMREATLAAICGTTPTTERPTESPQDTAARLLRTLSEQPVQLGEPETSLLRKWLTQLARSGDEVVR